MARQNNAPIFPANGQVTCHLYPASRIRSKSPLQDITELGEPVAPNPPWPCLSIHMQSSTKLHKCPKIGVILNFYGNGYRSDAMAPLVRTESLPPWHCRRLQKHNILSEQHFPQQNAYFRNLRCGRAI